MTTQTLLPSLVIDIENFYGPVYIGLPQINPTNVQDTDVFYSPNVAWVQNLSPPQFQDVDTVYNPVLTNSKTVAPFWVDADLIWTPAVTGGY